MAKQRNSYLSLYRQYRADETFRHDFANLVRAAIEDADLLSKQQINFHNEPSVSYAAEGRP